MGSAPADEEGASLRGHMGGTPSVATASVAAAAGERGNPPVCVNRAFAYTRLKLLACTSMQSIVVLMVPILQALFLIV